MSKRPADEYLASPGHVHRPRLNSTPPTGLSSASVPPPSVASTGAISTSTSNANTPPPGGHSPGFGTAGPGGSPNVYPADTPTEHHRGLVTINAGSYQMGGDIGQQQQQQQHHHHHHNHQQQHHQQQQQPQQKHGTSIGQGQPPVGYPRATLPTQQGEITTVPQALQQRVSPSESPVTQSTPLPSQSTDASVRKPKQETPTTDPSIYSDTVRKGISNHSRTGQACDRCKVRKIRCDQAPDQCTNCRNQNLECLVTDRTTGRTVRRDYLTELERRMTALENSNKGLTQLLKAHAGIEAKPFEYNPVKAKLPIGHTVDDQGNIVPDPEWQAAGWTEECGVFVRRAADVPSSPPAPTPALATTTHAPAKLQPQPQPQPQGPQQGPPQTSQPPATGQQTMMVSRPSTNASQRPSPGPLPPPKPFRLTSDLETVRRPGLHLGIMSDAVENRSALMGTHLAVLGFAFNLADDSHPDVAEPDIVLSPNDPPVHNKSVRSLLRSIYHLHPVPELELPSYDTTSSYSQWYFVMIHPFLPIIHKPSYSAMLKKMYERGFVPEAWQVVQVHMVLAIIYYQIGTRNWEKPTERDTFVDLSNKHYHIALSKVSSLQMDPTFEAVQALTLISAHARSFPKPGAALHISYKAFNMAVDISLHRGTQPKPGQTTNLHLEMRKRVWWAILVVIVTLCGRLGKPMPISGAEFDVQFPEPIPEECLLEQGVDMSLRKEPCHYLVGLAGFRIIPMYLEMYSNLYAVKFDPTRYSDIIEALEAKLAAWRKGIPNELRVGMPGPAEEDGKVLATYTHLFGLEFHLCLRHPAVNESSPEDLKNTNIKICRDLCRDIYRYTSRLSDLKSLDTTFYQASIYLLCLMTVLSAVHKERHTLQPQEHAEFREEVEGWLRILQEVWKLMGVSDAPLRPLLHLVKSGLDGSGKPPMDQAALFRHVLQDILDRRKDPKATIPQAQTAIQQDQHSIAANPDQVHPTYQNGDMPPSSGTFGAGEMESGATMLDLAMSAEQLAAVGITDGMTWFPVPPGYLRAPNGIIMPMESMPTNIFSPSLPTVLNHLPNNMAGNSGGHMPVSHANSGWPLLIFDKNTNSASQQQQVAHQTDTGAGAGTGVGNNTAADYGQTTNTNATNPMYNG